MNNQAIAQDNIPHYYFFIRGLIRSQFHWHHFPTHFDCIAKQTVSRSTAVFFDIAGNGKRYQETTPFSISGMAQDIEQKIQHYLIDHSVDPNSKLHLVGISMGGMIAAELGSSSKIDIASVHIINSSFANLSPFWQRMQLAAVLNLVPKLFRTDTREQAILKWTSNNPTSLNLTKKWVKEAHLHPLTLRNAFAQLWAASHYFVNKKSHFNSIVYCSRKDRLVNWKCSAKLASHWQAPLEYELEAGHDLPMDNPVWLAEKIIQHSQSMGTG